MPSYDWKPFLQQFSKDMLADDAIKASLPPGATASNWFGYPGATEAQIVGTEARLGITLPPSYREFLAVTNGWLNIGYFVDRLWPVDQIDWFRVRNQGAIDAWLEGERYSLELYAPANITTPLIPDDEYFIYGDDQTTVTMRSEYLQTALEISDWGNHNSTVLRLNPRVIFDNGEWEAWFHASWLPGAKRYRSFWDLLQEEHKSYLAIHDGEA